MATQGPPVQLTEQQVNDTAYSVVTQYNNQNGTNIDPNILVGIASHESSFMSMPSTKTEKLSVLVPTMGYAKSTPEMWIP